MDSRAGGAVECMGDNTHTPGNQESIDMFEGGQNPDGDIAPINLESMEDEAGDSSSQSRGGEDDSMNPQLRALVTTVMAAITTESAKLTATIQQLQGDIKIQIKEVVRDLTAQFEASQNKFREDMQAKLNTERLGVLAKINEVAQKSETRITEISASVEVVQETINAKLESRIAEVKKYVNCKISEGKGDQALANRNAEEIVKVSEKIRELENRVTLGRHTTTQVVESGNLRGLTQSDQNAGVAGSSASSSRIDPGSCDIGSDETSEPTSVVNQPGSLGVSNLVNATSETLVKSVDLQELTLPTFTDSSKQVPLHFVRDLELYFKLRQTPENLKLPLAFRAVQEPIARQWFSSVFEKLGEYGEFKKGFTELLWNPNRQAGIRSKIYLDRHNPDSGESYVDHYIRYANLASTLEPPLQDADLLSALTAHYEPKVQQGLLCGNFKCTQEVLGYLSKFQSLQEERVIGSTRSRDSPRGDVTRRPHMGVRRDDQPNRGSQFNVRAVYRQTGHPGVQHNARRNGNSRGRDFFGRRGEQVGDYNSNPLNPNTRPFNPRTMTAGENSNRTGPHQSNEAPDLNQ